MINITSLGQARDYGDRLSKLLKKYRELANFRLTQGELATRIGVSARSIRDWESGINLPTARNLKKIIEVYHSSGLFTAGKEREEAEELWILRQGKDLSNTFPLFDTTWLESVTSNQEDVKPDDRIEQPSLDQITIIGVEKNVTPIPTNLMSGNLPLQLTSFIGRDKELKEIQQLLQNTRLLTITGTGGTGKTRLSQEIAKLTQETDSNSYPDGVWWVELTPLTDRQQVMQAIISALMLEKRQEGDLYELLQNHLQPKKLLLVLDNCEHLVEAVAGLVKKFLRDCPYLQILATSRESLNLTGEQVWPLEGLNITHDQKRYSGDLENSAAVRLFVERARAAQPSFELNSENSGVVLEICRQLDGLPLAIELAAARVKGLGVEQISRRLQQSFKLLSGGSQANTPHHQTVQAMMDWSYNLLSTEEQLLLRRMAVFRGDFSLEAAEAVLGGEAGSGFATLDPDDVLILILQLVNKSLVVAIHLENNTKARYRLLEMVRQYSQEKLEASGEVAYLSYKLGAFFTEFVEKGYPNFFNNSTYWVARLEQENTNLREALRWSLASNQGQASLGKVPVPPDELALRLSAGLGRFWYLKNNFSSEGKRWLEASLALEGLAEREDLKAVRAQAYFYLGTVALEQASHYLTLSAALFEELGDKFMVVAALTNLGAQQINIGDYADAKAQLLHSLALTSEIEDKYFLGYILVNLGRVAITLGNLDEGLAYLQESEPIHRLHNDHFALSDNLLFLGIISRMKKDLPQALSKTQESLQISRNTDYKQGIALALTHLSVYQRKLQNYQEASLLAEEAKAICEEAGDSYALSSSSNNMAVIKIMEGKVAEAHRFAKQSLEFSQKNGDKLGITESLYTFALLAAAQNKWEDFVWLYTAAEILRQKMSVSSNYMNEQAELDYLYEEATRHLDHATIDRLTVKGLTNSLEDIVKQALAF